MNCSGIVLSSSETWACRLTRGATSTSRAFGSMLGATMPADKASANTVKTTSRCSSKRPSKGMPCEPRFSRQASRRLVLRAPAPYVEAAKRLWRNMITRRLYITGGVGAIARDEKFGGDFVLPNNGYLETCAAVACGFLDFNLFLASADAAKVDELERSLYNGALLASR